MHWIRNGIGGAGRGVPATAHLHLAAGRPGHRMVVECRGARDQPRSRLPKCWDGIVEPLLGVELGISAGNCEQIIAFIWEKL